MRKTRNYQNIGQLTEFTQTSRSICFTKSQREEQDMFPHIPRNKQDIK